MAISLASLKREGAVKPARLLFYGVQGVGKTSLAAEFPDPVFIQTEDGTPGGIELTTFGHLTAFNEVMEALTALQYEQHDFQTVVIDTLDALEPLLWAQACADNGWSTIEDPGFGKGYVAAEVVWHEYFKKLDALRDRGMMVVQLAHSEIIQFNSPISDPYHRYHVKLHKRAAALVQELADVVAFINFRVSLKKIDVGFDKTMTHAEGAGIREMHVEERPGFAAKSRLGMPSTLPYKRGQGFAVLAKYLPGYSTAAEAEAAA